METMQNNKTMRAGICYNSTRTNDDDEDADDDDDDYDDEGWKAFHD